MGKSRTSAAGRSCGYSAGNAPRVLHNRPKTESCPRISCNHREEFEWSIQTSHPWKAGYYPLPPGLCFPKQEGQDIAEYALVAFDPIKRIVPTTITRMTANNTAISPAQIKRVILSEWRRRDFVSEVRIAARSRGLSVIAIFNINQPGAEEKLPFRLAIRRIPRLILETLFWVRSRM